MHRKHKYGNNTLQLNKKVYCISVTMPTKINLNNKKTTLSVIGKHATT